MPRPLPPQPTFAAVDTDDRLEGGTDLRGFLSKSSFNKLVHDYFA